MKVSALLIDVNIILKHKHWRGIRDENVWKGPPMLEFYLSCVQYQGAFSCRAMHLRVELTQAIFRSIRLTLHCCQSPRCCFAFRADKFSRRCHAIIRFFFALLGFNSAYAATFTESREIVYVVDMVDIGRA